MVEPDIEKDSKQKFEVPPSAKQLSKGKKRALSLRTVLLKTHLWLSLVFGLFIVFTCATGSLIVFVREIDAALNPHLFRVTPSAKPVNFDEVKSAIQKAFPQKKLVTLSPPNERWTCGVYKVQISGSPPTEVFLDPGTGEILGARIQGRSFLNDLVRMHIALMSNESAPMKTFSKILKKLNIKIQPGRCAVGIIGIILTIVLCTGLYLWWPKISNFARGFRIRRNEGAYSFFYDFHKLVGIVSLPCLLVIAITGVTFEFPEFAQKVVYGTFGGKPPVDIDPREIKAVPSSSPPLTFEQVRKITEQDIPGSTVTGISNPPDKFIVRLERPYFIFPRFQSVIYLDQYTGKVLAEQDEKNFSFADILLSRWRFPLHVGYFGHGLFLTFMRIFYVIVGFVPLGLFATGIFIWLKKRSSSRKS